jgi:hypothetical protein
MDANIFDCGTNFLNLPIGFPLSGEYKAYLHLILCIYSNPMYISSIIGEYCKNLKLCNFRRKENHTITSENKITTRSNGKIIEDLR